VDFDRLADAWPNVRCGDGTEELAAAM